MFADTLLQTKLIKTKKQNHHQQTTESHGSFSQFKNAELYAKMYPSVQLLSQGWLVENEDENSRQYCYFLWAASCPQRKKHRLLPLVAHTPLKQTQLSPFVFPTCIKMLVRKQGLSLFCLCNSAGLSSFRSTETLNRESPTLFPVLQKGRQLCIQGIITALSSLWAAEW